jgi:hypothetical protein
VVVSACLLPNGAGEFIQNSMEFQVKLPNQQFANRDFGLLLFYQYLQSLGEQYPILQLQLTNLGTPEHYSEIHYDSGNGLLTKQNLIIRFRFWTNAINNSFIDNEVTFKFRTRLQSYAFASPMACAPSKLYTCAEKVEQDVHQNYTRFAHETKVVGIPAPPHNITAQEFSSFFPGILQFNGINGTTVLGPRDDKNISYFYRTAHIGLIIGGEKTVETTLDFQYRNETNRDKGIVPPDSVSFSIRLFATNSCASDGYSVHLMRRMDYLFFLLLNNGTWNAQIGAGPSDESTWSGFWGDI